LKLVAAHCGVSQSVAAGLHGMPDVASSFAATQAAYRFLHNDRIGLRALAEPLIEFARQEAPQLCDAYLLVAHDWSQLMYAEHARKRDRIVLSSRRIPEGYELQSALLISDRDGGPIAPVAMSLRAADGVHCSRSWKVRPCESPLDELDPTMTYVEKLAFERPTVHLIDAEADSVAHYRLWSSRSNRLYLVRADDRIVEHQGVEKRCSAVREKCRAGGELSFTREVLYHGRTARQHVAEAMVRLKRAGQRNRPSAGDRKRVPGPPLTLRLVISEVRDLDGKMLAVWYLLTNVPAEVDAATIALWYYWRWNIESFFKLIKSAGLQIEQWQQKTAGALARRLLIGSMACVAVWRLSRSQHPQAEPARRLLVRLSGRQMKRGVTHTKPALLAGLWVLLAMLDTLEHYDLGELRAFGDLILNHIAKPPPNNASKLV
jgi:hypothetical protein